MINGQISQVKQAIGEPDFFDTLNQVISQTIRNRISIGRILDRDNNLVAAATINNGVCAISTINDIHGVQVAAAFALQIVTCEHIVTRTAIQGVIAPAAKQLVVECIALDQVIVRRAFNLLYVQ